MKRKNVPLGEIEKRIQKVRLVFPDALGDFWVYSGSKIQIFKCILDLKI